MALGGPTKVLNQQKEEVTAFWTVLTALSLNFRVQV